MDILEALKTLDVENDEHWTADGLPKVDVIAELTGEDVKRAQISDAWPEFNRTLANADEEPPEQEVQDEPPANEFDRLDKLRVAAEDELNTISKEEMVLAERRRDLERKVHRIASAMDRARPANEGQNAITNYLARQKQISLDKAARRQQLVDSGVAELLKGAGKAPIDAAMNQRKPARGSQRPPARATQ